MAALKKIMKKCSSLGKKKKLDNNGGLPEDVPKGHFAVYVGETTRSRYIIPISWLDHPDFQNLLQRAEEEFGFSHHHHTALIIPCEVVHFQSLINSIAIR